MPGRRCPAHRGKRFEAAEQRVDQGSRVHSGARMHHHAGRFVDGYEIGIVVEHAQGNGFGRGV